MAVTLPSDIIADVARAADPAMVRAARDRLMAGRPAAANSGSFVISATGNASSIDNAKSVSNQNNKAPFVRFEAMVLQTFVQSMLPKNAESVYGKGLSGDIWQSMMAEKIAQQVASHGGIGIADRLLKDFKLVDGKKFALSGASDTGAVVGQGQSKDLATALLQQVQQDMIRTARDGEESTTSVSGS